MISLMKMRFYHFKIFILSFSLLSGFVFTINQEEGDYFSSKKSNYSALAFSKIKSVTNLSARGKNLYLGDFTLDEFFTRFIYPTSIFIIQFSNWSLCFNSLKTSGLSPPF